MSVTVLFFGATADAVGSRELVLPTGEFLTTKSLIDRLSQLHPALADRNLLIAVNEEYVVADTDLESGDKVAIFTPVSGG